MSYLYPYGDSQQLNLAWFLAKFKELYEYVRQLDPGGSGSDPEAILSRFTEQYDTNKSYIPGDYVIYNGYIYKANRSTGGTFDSGAWDAALPVNDIQGLRILLGGLSTDLTELEQNALTDVTYTPGAATANGLLRETKNGTTSNVMTVDKEPTENSQNPVKSGGVYNELTELKGALTSLENSKAVRYDADQSLTAAQKIKVYSNIFGASNNAGFHNSLYRGKDITSYLTDGSLWDRINGTGGYTLFEDLFLGDFITRTATGGASNTYVIVDFDYYIRTGASPELTSHHLVMMPRERLNLTGYMASDASANGETTVTFKWNLTNTTANGYIGSRIRNVTMPQCDSLVKAVFGASHVLTPDVIYPNAFGSDGRASGWAWASNNNFASSYLGKLCCDLLNETQVYGSQVWSYGSDGRAGYEVGIDKWRLAIFRLYPAFANIRAYWWLRSVSSATHAASVDYNGGADNYGASYAFGVRPRFLVS